MGVEVDELAQSIAEMLAEYSTDVENAVDDETKSLAKEIVKSLKENPNISESDKETKHYKRRFYCKRISEGEYIIHNHKYSLAHLLENGHALRNGGRSRAFPHWKQAEEQAQTLEERLLRRIEQI